MIEIWRNGWLAAWPVSVILFGENNDGGNENQAAENI
jgi:hypothetical protein